MNSVLLLLACCLAVAVPLGLALRSRPQQNRTGDSDEAGAAVKDSTSEPDIVETVEALAAALRSHGDEATAEKLLDALYGAASSTELVMGLRFALRTIDRRKLHEDVALLMRAERLLS